MKNFIKSMMSDSDGSISSKRVNGTLCLLFFFFIGAVGVFTHTMTPEMLCNDTMMLIGGFFAMTTIVSVAEAKTPSAYIK